MNSVKSYRKSKQRFKMFEQYCGNVLKKNRGICPFKCEKCSECYFFFEKSLYKALRYNCDDLGMPDGELISLAEVER